MFVSCRRWLPSWNSLSTLWVIAGFFGCLIDGIEASRNCSTTADCSYSQLVCKNGKCLTLEQTTGLQGWVIGTMAVGVTIIILAIGGCCYLWPSCPASARFAHPSEKERLNELSIASNNCNLPSINVPQIQVNMVNEEKF